MSSNEHSPAHDGSSAHIGRILGQCIVRTPGLNATEAVLKIEADKHAAAGLADEEAEKLAEIAELTNSGVDIDRLELARAQDSRLEALQRLAWLHGMSLSDTELLQTHRNVIEAGYRLEHLEHPFDPLPDEYGPGYRPT